MLYGTFFVSCNGLGNKRFVHVTLVVLQNDLLSSEVTWWLVKVWLLRMHPPRCDGEPGLRVLTFSSFSKANSLVMGIETEPFLSEMIESCWTKEPKRLRTLVRIRSFETMPVISGEASVLVSPFEGVCWGFFLFSWPTPPDTFYKFLNASFIPLVLTALNRAQRNKVGHEA